MSNNTHTTLASLFTAIANAIRTKDSTTEPIVADTFPDRILAIPSGGASGDVTSIEYDAGKVAICYLKDKGTVTESTDILLESAGTVTTSGSDIILELADACQ